MLYSVLSKTVVDMYLIQFHYVIARARGATLKVGELTSDSKWKGGGAENTFSSVTLYNFQSPRALIAHSMCAF